MNAVCLVDTTVFLEILNVPGMTANRSEILNELQGKIENKESLFLPMATILETGNHIAQNGDGNQRRKCATFFVDQVKKALREESPFKPISFLEKEHLQQWLYTFPDYATREIGLGDLSIIQDWNRQCDLNKGRTVYIWSLDDDLRGYVREPEI
jgi:hypothetical protein